MSMEDYNFEQARKNWGGPAFPTGDGMAPYNPGMTLRDYFAAEAMKTFVGREDTTFATDARQAYEAADAMLKARG